MDRTVIGIDLGTSGCRAVAYDARGKRLGAHYLEYGVTHPEPGAAEQEAEGWWSAARACVKAVVAGLSAPGDVVGVGLCAQGHSWAPTDEQFRPLRPGLTWLDTRAAGIARELLEARGAHDWGRRAGKAPGPWHTLPQILWLRDVEPDTDRRAAHYLFAHDFLIARLTGKIVTDFTTAAASLLLDIERFEWDKALALEYRVDVRRFAPLRPAGSVAGPLDWRVAKDLGLPPAIPVAVGAQDQKAAALAAGIEEGIATVSLGTATAITALARRPGYDEAAAIPCFPYLQEGAWVLEAPLTTTGASLRWLRDLARGLGAEGLEYDELSDMAARAGPGSGGVRFLPFLAGAGAPHWIGDARGAFVGIGLDTTSADIARSVLEGVAFEIETNLQAMRRQGVAINGLRVFGGGARSDLWAGIIASVTGMRVERSSEVEMAVAGAALFAMRAAGICEDLAEGQARLGGKCDTFEPDPEAGYEAVCDDYCGIRGRYWRMISGGSER